MAHSRFTLPALTTSRLPMAESSSSSSSPLTPLSELSATSNASRTSLITPTSSSDAKPSKSYITYPDHSFPPRPLTPPPKSRFVNLFESISSAAQPPSASSRCGSIEDEETPFVSNSLSFASSTTKQIPRNLTLPQRGAWIEPALKSAPMTTSTRSAPSWGPFSSVPHSPPVASRGILQSSPQIDQLHSTVLSLRHQLTIKSFALHTAEAEITRLSEAYSAMAQERASLEERCAFMQQRLDELDLLMGNQETGVFPLDCERINMMNSYGVTQSIPREQELKTWDVEIVKKEVGLIGRPSFHRTETETAQLDDCLTDKIAVLELPDDEARHTVLTRTPEMPADIIVARLADVFLSPEFDFEEWIAASGLQLPSSIKSLAPLTWEDRLKLDSNGLKEMGVADVEERSYIMRVLKSIAEGEVSASTYRYQRSFLIQLHRCPVFTRPSWASSSPRNNTCVLCASSASTNMSPICVAFHGLAVCSSMRMT